MPPGFALACPDATIETGGINAHTHLYSGLVPFDMPPPIPPPEDFLQILQRLWWRLDRALDEATLRAAARYYVAESLLAGTTTLIDHHESPHLISGSLDLLADTCAELGIRAVLGYGATERNGGAPEADAGLEECARFIRSLRAPAAPATGRAHIQGAVAIHASFTVSDSTLRATGRLCRELNAPLHIHLAEDRADLADAQRRGYAGPLQRLVALEVPLRNAILAHGVHLSVAEVAQATAAGAWLVQNPRSNRNNRVGYATALRDSPRVALGTDGFPAKMEEEASALAPVDRAQLAARRRAAAELAGALFDLPFATDLPALVGSAADFRVVDSRGARHVIVGGRLVVQDRSLLTADQTEIRATAAAAAHALWARMACF
jgi:cytosine/adenosine deaminase-related metal-dependent hydrolase